MGQTPHILELIKVRVIPDDNPAGSGILLDGTISLPFTLEREWSGNVGYYFEQYRIKAGDKQVFQSIPKQIFVRGLQSLTAQRDRVDERIALDPGVCHLEFLIDGIHMATVEVPVEALAPV